MLTISDAAKKLSNRPSLRLALQRAKDRKPTHDGVHHYSCHGLGAPIAAIRTLGPDPAIYMLLLQNTAIAAVAAFVTLVPQLGLNSTPCDKSCREIEYAQFVASGLLSGTDENAIWAENATDRATCPRGLLKDAPWHWGRPGGTFELYGAPRLAWTHVITDALAFSFLIGAMLYTSRRQILDSAFDKKVNEQILNAATLASQRNASFRRNGLRDRWSKVHDRRNSSITISQENMQDVMELQTLPSCAASPFKRLFFSRPSSGEAKVHPASPEVALPPGANQIPTASASNPLPQTASPTALKHELECSREDDAHVSERQASSAPGSPTAPKHDSERLNEDGVQTSEQQASLVPASTTLPKHEHECLIVQDYDPAPEAQACLDHSSAGSLDPVPQGSINGIEAVRQAILEITDDSVDVRCCCAKEWELVSSWLLSEEAILRQADVLARSCTILLAGWPYGEPIPAEAIEVVRMRGMPVAISQAFEVSEYFDMLAKVNRAETQCMRAQNSSTAVKLSSQWKVRTLRSNLAVLRKRPKRWLPYAFVTFDTPAQASCTRADKQIQDALKAFGISIGVPPLPSDINWQHLGSKPSKKDAVLRHLSFGIMVMFVAPLIVAALIIATGLAQMALPWAPFNCAFTSWCPLAKVYGGLYWMSGIIMFTLVYQLLGWLVYLQVSGYGELRTRPTRKSIFYSLRDTNATESGSQLQFVKAVGWVEMLSVLILMSLLLYHPIGTTLCDATCVCWWINPKYSAETWYDFGTGLTFNSLVNCFVGDALLMNFIVPLLRDAATRKLAVRANPTQELLDEAVRTRDPRYVAWRIVHLIKANSFALCLMPAVPFAILPYLVYLILSILIDRFNLLSRIEPVTSSNGIVMRYAITFMVVTCVPNSLSCWRL